ncbi:MAG: hypothetical protein Q8O89_03135 [Nanoarchaeota archaeon]|nr:hypothetical protein [Nanoarchaeota archaeon]
MNTQINLRLPEKLLTSATVYAEKNGYGTVQDFVRETLRERLFDEKLSTREAALIKKLIEVSDKKGLYGTEEELFRKLRARQKGVRS